MAFAGSVTIYPPVVSEGAEALGASLVSVHTEHTAVTGFGQAFFVTPDTVNCARWSMQHHFAVNTMTKLELRYLYKYLALQSVRDIVTGQARRGAGIGRA
jgi:hypothetical protein